jgi:hypothetical protein
MRLTLRTLMAWMDDTLPPKDVRRIGRQLERSKFSQDLSRRIRRVVRQRRLTVPGMGSNQLVDANIVAAYLDNNLPGDATSTYESLCLNNDVHLAEAAASHEILSVLDQQCSISPEVYATMYRIVKAPEARVHAGRPMPNPSAVPDIRLGKGVRADDGEGSDWPLPPFVRNTRRFVAACGLIVAFLAFGGLALDRIVGPNTTLFPEETESPELTGEIGPATEFQAATQPEPPAEAVSNDEPAEKAADDDLVAVNPPMATNTESPKPEPAINEPMPKAEEPVTKKAESEPAPSVPTAAPAHVQFGLNDIATIADTTILLTAPKDSGTAKTWSFWKSAPKLPVFLRFAGADSPEINIGSVKIILSPGLLVELADDAPAAILAGKTHVDSTSPGEFHLRTAAGRDCVIVFAKGSRFVVESRPASVTAAFAEPGSVRNDLTIRSEKGNLVVKFGRSDIEVRENQLLTIDQGEKNREAAEPVPSTRQEVANDSGAALVTRMMRRYLSTNRPLATSIIDSEADEMPEVKNLSMKIALWIDRPDLVTNVLTDLDNPALRQSAIEAVRQAMLMGDFQASKVIDGCVEELALGDEESLLLRSLFAPKSDEESLENKRALVTALEHDARLIRQLALSRLMQISGRDSMGFDPDEPTPKGVEAWRAWIGMDVQGSRP